MTVQLVVTNRLRKAIDDVLRLENTPGKLRDELEKWKDRDDSSAKSSDSKGTEDLFDDKDSTIPFKKVKEVFDLLKEGGTAIYLNELLQGSNLYFEPIEEPKKSPELLARLKKLQAKQDQLRYRSMVQNIDRELLSKNAKEIGFEVRSTSRQLSSVVNFVLSVAGTFAFGFMCSQYAFSNIGLRVMFGIILASIVAMAELYFMARTEI